MNFRRILVRGLIAILPTIATVWLLVLLCRFFYDYGAEPVSNALRWVLQHDEWARSFLQSHPLADQVGLAIAGFVLALALFAALGLLVTALFGKKLFAAFEHALLQLPVVRAIYPYARQVVDYFFDKKRPAFQAVVAVPYPHPDVYSLAFVTSDGLKSLNEAVKGSLVSVFIPSSPVPMTGWIAFVPADKVRPLAMPVDDAFRFMVSAGLLAPEEEKVDLGAKSPLRVAAALRHPHKEGKS